MLIGQDGALSPAQEAKLAAQKETDALDAKERARLAKLSRKHLAHEIRTHVKKTTNHLGFCYGLGLLVLLGEPFKKDDPYCRTYPKKPKRTRTRGKATVGK